VTGRGRRALALGVLVLASGCALWRGLLPPLTGPVDPPLAVDDLDPASIRAVVSRTLPVYEKRGQTRARDGARRLLRILEEHDDPAVRRALIDRDFVVRRVRAPVLLTAYYEPELPARDRRDARFRSPLYGRPPDLVDGTPYATRGEIYDGALAGRGLEIAWLADPIDLFFLQVQGSGRLRFEDGRSIGAHFAGTNGRPYTSVGRVMIERGLLSRDAASAADIRRVLAAMPEAERRALLATNERYVFFALGDGPVRGSLGIPLTAGRSVATDPSLVPSGALAYLETPTYRRFVVAQDTGAAIVGARCDLFLGAGDAVGAVAGRTNERGRLYVLEPR
jgi:membrane-bound lytic murein transglycosylase A